MKKYLRKSVSSQRYDFFCHLHGVQAYGGQLPRNHFDREPSPLLELMSLRLRYKPPPDIQVLGRPSVRAAREDVVRQYIVVAESRHDWYRKCICTTAVAALSKNLGKFRDHVLVLLDDLLRVACSKICDLGCRIFLLNVAWALGCRCPILKLFLQDLQVLR